MHASLSSVIPEPLPLSSVLWYKDHVCRSLIVIHMKGHLKGSRLEEGWLARRFL